VLKEICREQTGPNAGLVEPLSDREREVLVILAHRVPNQEIADKPRIVRRPGIDLS